MASVLYKETGLSFVEVPSPPTTNTQPVFFTPGQGLSDSPFTPNPLAGGMWGLGIQLGNKPYRPPASDVDSPDPGNNQAINDDEDREWVILEADNGDHILIPRALTDGSASSTVI